MRQVIGWREYVWGVYWRWMPGYRDANDLGADRPLPPAFTGARHRDALRRTHRCERHDYGWTHHIQRLMVLGNLSLLPACEPDELVEWMWAGFVDGAEWVMLPNVLGMALHADGGRMATKPYAAGGAYIDRMSDYCRECRFDRKQRTGADACPFTTLVLGLPRPSRDSLRTASPDGPVGACDAQAQRSRRRPRSCGRGPTTAGRGSAVNEALAVRPLVRADLPQLADWLGEPHVHRWWDHDPADVEADFGVTLEGDRPTELYVIELDGRPVGMIQRYRIADYPEWRDALTMIEVPDEALGIDYLIGEEGLTNRGVGTALIRLFVAKAWAEMPDVSAIIVDVDPENRPSWRVLERAGFQRIWSGVMQEPGETEPGPVVIYRLNRPG